MKTMKLTDSILIAALLAASPLLIITLTLVVVTGIALFGPNKMHARALFVFDRLVLIVAILRGGQAGTAFVERQEFHSQPPDASNPSGHTRSRIMELNQTVRLVGIVRD